MRIQYLNGGLANQVFQHIFARFAELYNNNGETWFLDDSFFFTNHVHNGYELDKVFGIKANLLSKSFDEDVWEEFIKNKKNGISIPQSFKNLGVDIQLIAEYENYKEHNPFDGAVHLIVSNDFSPEITALPGDTLYYHGYWLNQGWYTAYQDILQKELSFPPIADKKNQEYADLILSTKSVAVHVRRGDYVKIGWAAPNEFYLNTTKKLLATHPDAVYFIFSDDIKWCKDNCKDLGFNLPKETIYIEGNVNGNNYRDLQLMSLCQGMILSKSAFCFLASLLGTQPKFIYHDIFSL